MTFDGNIQHAIGNISSKVTTLQFKKLLNYSSYEKVIRPQNFKIHDLGISRLPFQCNPTKKSGIYYREEGGGLLPSPSHMNVMSPKQVHDPKLVHLH